MRRSKLEAKRNFWRSGTADEASVLIDAENYFSNLYDNLLRAERTIYILGWDIDSRQSLLPGGAKAKGYPLELGALLDRLARERPELHIYVLTWDFAPIYLPSREVFQTIKLGLQTHPRLHFCFDDQHPLSASHHQKLVVLDDQLAYCGGLDLTGARWDSMAHQPFDGRRTTPSGSHYAPFHDVQIALRGRPAKWLGELCRERWYRATFARLQAPRLEKSAQRFVLPRDTSFEKPRIAIARTVPQFKNASEVREVEQSFLAMIRGAKRFLYIENQYFTATSIAHAVRQSLEAKDGPEIVMVMPKVQDSWLSQLTMGTLSARTIDSLRQSDRYGRFRVLYPEDSRLPPPFYINVHAKFFVADGDFLRIGSANLNNRSMGLDTECDVIVDASGNEAATARIHEIVGILVAHHLGVAAFQVVAAWQELGSLSAAISKLNHRGPKSLEAYKPRLSPLPWNTWLADLAAIDPEKTLSLEALVDDFVFRGKAAHDLTLTERVPSGFWLTLLSCLVLTTLRFGTPLGNQLDAAALAAVGHPVLWFLAAFLVLGALAVPLNLLIAVTACFFAGLPAIFLALLGSMILAALGFLIGRHIRPSILERILPHSLYYLRQAVVRHSSYAMFLIRFFPIAPFQLMNVASGLAGVGFRPYFWGTLAGLLPGTIGIVVFLRSLFAQIASPNGQTTVNLIAVLLLSFASYWLLARRLRRRASVGKTRKKAALRRTSRRECESTHFAV